MLYPNKNVQIILKNDHLWSFFNIICSFLGSIFEPCFIETRVIMNRVIKRLECNRKIRAELNAGVCYNVPRVVKEEYLPIIMG